MIKNSTPLSMTEVADLVGKGEKQDAIKKFIKQFSKIDIKKTKELKKELETLGLLKLKTEHIVKIIDFLPEDSEDLIKLLSDVSLDQDEINKIIEIVKKY